MQKLSAKLCSTMAGWLAHLPLNPSTSNVRKGSSRNEGMRGCWQGMTSTTRLPACTTTSSWNLSALCRKAGDVKAARSHLAAVFEAAALCVGAKLLEAAVMLEEGDYGGVVAMTGQVSRQVFCPHVDGQQPHGQCGSFVAVQPCQSFARTPRYLAHPLLSVSQLAVSPKLLLPGCSAFSPLQRANRRSASSERP